MPVGGALLVYLIPPALLYAVVAWGLWHTPNALIGMNANSDGYWAVWNVAGMLEWGRFLDLSPFNPLSGTGSLFLPTLPWVNPAAAALALPVSKDLSYLISYSVYFLELMASTVFLMRTLGFTPVRSVFGGMVYVLLLFPPVNAYFGSISWYSLAPFNAHLVAIANISLAVFLKLGGTASPVRNAALILTFELLIFAGLHSSPLTFLTYGPVYGLAAISLVRWRERRALIWQISAVLLASALFLLSGFAEYIASTAAISSRVSELPPAFEAGWQLLTTKFWIDVWDRFSLCGQAAMPLCPQNNMLFIGLAAIGGAAIQSFLNPPQLRSLARFFIALFCGIQIYAFLSIPHLFGKLHTLSTPYIVWSSYTFFTIFIVVLLFSPADLFEYAKARGLISIPSIIVSAFVVLAVLSPPFAAFMIWKHKISPSQPPASEHKISVPILGRSSLRETSPSAITEYLIEHASIKPGLPFRGYVATYLGDQRGHIRHSLGFKPSRRMEVGVYPEARQYFDRHYGNRFQETDLWEFGIPTLEEYGQWITISVYSFINALFSERGDVLNGAFLRIFKPELGFLAALGVRYLITDMLIADNRVTMRARHESSSAGPIYLYEIAGANLGESVSTAVRVSNFQEALARFRAGNRSEAVVFNEVPGALHRAEGVALRFEKDGFRVIARSDGPAIVVVPVQFSQCLASVAPTTARLFRANGIQTGIAFSGPLDLTVRFQFGLWGSTACRSRDVADIDALGMRDVSR